MGLIALATTLLTILSTSPVYAGKGGSYEPYIEVVVDGSTLIIDVEESHFEVDEVFVNGRVFYYEGRPLRLALTEFENDEDIMIYAKDIDGNQSNIITLNLEDLEDDEPLPTPPTRPDNPFTPNGQATIVDVATDEDGKDFFTFVTPAGNEFFLVIDHQRATDNVFFLNAVTENDLMALAEISTPEQPAIQPPALPDLGDLEDEDYLEDEPVIEDEDSGNGTMIFIGFAVVAIGIAGYYVKVIRPKQIGGIDEDEYEDFEEDLGEELTFEDEVEDIEGEEI